VPLWERVDELPGGPVEDPAEAVVERAHVFLRPYERRRERPRTLLQAALGRPRELEWRRAWLWAARVDSGSGTVAQWMGEAGSRDEAWAQAGRALAEWRERWDWRGDG